MNTENDAKQTYSLMNYYKANLLETTTQIKKLTFGNHYKNAFTCTISNTVSSYRLEVNTVLAFIVTTFLSFLMILSLSCASLDFNLVLTSFPFEYLLVQRLNSPPHITLFFLKFNLLKIARTIGP